MRPEARPIKFTNGHARSYVKIENEVDTTDMQNNPLQQCYSSPISREKHRLGNTAVLSSATFNAPESSKFWWVIVFISHQLEEILLKVMPTMLFHCVIIVTVVVWTAICYSFTWTIFKTKIFIVNIIVIVLDVNSLWRCSSPKNENFCH